MSFHDNECWNCDKQIREDKSYWIPTICDEEINNLMKFCSKKCCKEYIEKELNYAKID